MLFTKLQLLSSRRESMLHSLANFLSGSARAFTDAFAKAPHTSAQFFSTFQRLGVGYVLAKTFATASGVFAALLVHMTDARVFPPIDITARTATPVRHLHDTAILILVLLIFHSRVGRCRRAGKCEWKGKQHYE